MNKQSIQNKVVVLDRDGTIVVDREYLSDPTGLEFMPRAVEGLRELHELGYRLVVVTNQSGVGRGLYTRERLHEIHERLTDMMGVAGIPLAGIYYCPHKANDGCACRKPATGLMHQASSELKFEPSAAIMIGDKFTDVEFGRRAGATTILLAAKLTAATMTAVPDFIAKDLWAAAGTVRALKRST